MENLYLGCTPETFRAVILVVGEVEGNQHQSQGSAVGTELRLLTDRRVNVESLDL